MTTIIVTDLSGQQSEIPAEKGLTLMQVIRDAGFDDLLATCGGSCSCATCQVYVDLADQHLLPPMIVDERELLEGSSVFRPESRLSCQIPVSERLDGLRVTIAPAD